MPRRRQTNSWFGVVHADPERRVAAADPSLLGPRFPPWEFGCIVFTTSLSCSDRSRGETLDGGDPDSREWFGPEVGELLQKGSVLGGLILPRASSRAPEGLSQDLKTCDPNLWIAVRQRTLQEGMKG